VYPEHTKLSDSDKSCAGGILNTHRCRTVTMLLPSVRLFALSLPTQMVFQKETKHKASVHMTTHTPKRTVRNPKCTARKSARAGTVAGGQKVRLHFRRLRLGTALATIPLNTIDPQYNVINVHDHRTVSQCGSRTLAQQPVHTPLLGQSPYSIRDRVLCLHQGGGTLGLPKQVQKTT
jgi:hypothetical protein